MEQMAQMEKSQELEQQGCGCGFVESQRRESAEKKAEAVEKAPRRVYAPAVDIIDADGEIQLIADVPGVPEGGVDLNLEKDTLTLSAVPADGVIAGKQRIHSEYGVGEYRRSFVLSGDIDRENISASLKNGVVRIRLPRTRPSARKIQVA